MYGTGTGTGTKLRDKTVLLRYVSWVLILHQLVILPLPLLHAISATTYDTPILSTNQTTQSNTLTFLTTSYVATLILILVSISLTIIGAIYSNFRMSRPMRLSCGFLSAALFLDICIYILEIVRIVTIFSGIILTPFVLILVLSGFILILLLMVGFVLKIVTILFVIIVLKQEFL